MIYDGFDFSTLLKVEEIERCPVPSVSNDIVSIPGGCGGVFIGTSLESARVRVKTFSIARSGDYATRRSNLERSCRKIAGALVKGSPRKLILHDRPDLWNWAIIDGEPDFERYLAGMEMTVEFVLPDPVWHGRLHSDDFENGAGHVNVVGTWPTRPTITVHTSATSLTLQIDGYDFEISDTASLEGPITIDSQERTVSRPGGIVMCSLESDFPEWTRGQHEVVCPAPFSVEWEERWL